MITPAPCTPSDKKTLQNWHLCGPHRFAYNGNAVLLLLPLLLPQKGGLRC